MKPAVAVKSFLLPEYDKIIKYQLAMYERSITTFPSPTLSRDFMEAWKEWVDPSVSLDEFPYWYVGAGSSELLRALAHFYKRHQRGNYTYIYNLKGDFEGWNKFAEFAGVETRSVDGADKLGDAGVVYFSNPSAINGNYGFRSQPAVYRDLMESAYVIQDMAYIGTTDVVKLDVSGSQAVVFSCSKSLGMFAHRFGIMFTKFEMPELEFNNKFLFPVMACRLAMAIIGEYSLYYGKDRMRSLQRYAVDYFNSHGLYNMEASDSYLLAHGKNEHIQEVDAAYARGDYHNRFCLTPYYERVLCGLGEEL